MKQVLGILFVVLVRVAFGQNEEKKDTKIKVFFNLNRTSSFLKNDIKYFGSDLDVATEALNTPLIGFNMKFGGM
jgi:hypothetical protein